MTASVPGLKSATSWTSLAATRPPRVKTAFKRHVLAERDEVHLAIARCDSAARVEELRPDEDARLAARHELAVVVPEVEVDAVRANSLLQLRGERWLRVVEEGHGRLRPDHEPRAARRRLGGQLEVPPDVAPGVLRQPLVLLPDAALHEAHRDPPGLRQWPRQRPAAERPGRAQQAERGERRRAPLRSLEERDREEGGDRPRAGTRRRRRRSPTRPGSRAGRGAGCSPAGTRGTRRTCARAGAPSPPTGTACREDPSGPKRATSRPVAQPKSSGKRAKARHSASMISAPATSGSPPYWTTTRAVQYRTPSADTAPLR